MESKELIFGGGNFSTTILFFSFLAKKTCISFWLFLLRIITNKKSASSCGIQLIA